MAGSSSPDANALVDSTNFLELEALPPSPCSKANRRLQHARGHHHPPRLHRHPHRCLHDPRARPRRPPRERGRQAGIDLDIRYTDTSRWYSNYRIGETTAATEILVDRTTDRIVSAHLLGPEYAEIVNTIAVAIKTGLTTRQLKSATTAYPTVGSDLGSML